MILLLKLIDNEIIFSLFFDFKKCFHNFNNRSRRSDRIQSRHSQKMER